MTVSVTVQVWPGVQAGVTVTGSLLVLASGGVNYLLNINSKAVKGPLA